jgi:hypothetical protein
MSISFLPNLSNKYEIYLTKDGVRKGGFYNLEVFSGMKEDLLIDIISVIISLDLKIENDAVSMELAKEINSYMREIGL